jgi:hypothetical protein
MVMPMRTGIAWITRRMMYFVIASPSLVNLLRSGSGWALRAESSAQGTQDPDITLGVPATRAPRAELLVPDSLD